MAAKPFLARLGLTIPAAMLLTLGAGANVVLDTATGSQIGTSASQKLGFYGATPIVRPGATTDLRTALINLGLYTTGGATPLDLNGGALSAATGTFTGLVLTAASASGGAGFRLPHGAAPTSPVNGDVWTTTAGVYARINGSTIGPFGTGAGTGTVTSVDMSVPTELAVSGNPITTSGTLAVTWASASGNKVIASPANGSSGAYAGRALVTADIATALTTPGPIGSGTPSTGAFTTISASGVITSTLVTGTAPFTIASTTVVANLNASLLGGKTFADPGAIGSGTPSTGAFTTVSASGVITSTLATGTAPFTVASTTRVANLNVAAAALADTVTTNANLTGPITSSGNATSVAAQTGTGSTFVMQASPTLTTPDLGTPSAGVLTNCSGTAASLTAGHVTTNANLTGPITSSGNATAVAAQTGTGTTFVMDTSPTLVTPVIGAATGTSLSMGGALLTTYADSTVTPVIQAMGTGATTIGIARFSSTANQAPALYLAHSLGTTVGDYTASAASNLLGSLIFMGADGTDLSQACSISGSVDAGATVSANTIPGRFRLITNDSSGTATQAMAIDSSQVTIIGNSTSASDGTFAGGTIRPWLQVVENTSASHGMALTRYRAAATASVLYFGKSRSSTIGTMTVVNTGDTLGTIDWQGADGTNFVSGAQIIVTATGTPAGGVMPGNMVIKTATAAGTLTTALTIDNAQTATFGGNVASSSTTTGTVIVTGGQGISGNLNVGGNLGMAGGTATVGGVTQANTNTATSGGLSGTAKFFQTVNPASSSTAILTANWSAVTTAAGCSQNLTDSTSSMRAVTALATHAGTGTVTAMSCVLTQCATTNSSGTITSAFGMLMLDGSKSGGTTITTLYGLKINDQTAGSTNYAIYTGSGTVHIGDTLEIADAKNIALNTTTGTKIGTATTQKLAFYNSTPIVQPNGTGETTGFTAGSGTAVKDDSTFTGNVGSTAYRVSDIVKALKNLGLMAA